MTQDRSGEALLRELARISTDIGPVLVPPGHRELLAAIASAAKDLFNAAACSVALLDDAQQELVFYVASGAGGDEVVGLRVPVGRGIAGWVVTSGQPIAIEDVTKDPRFASDVAESTGYVPRSIVAMPLQTEDEMLGVIQVLDRRGDGRDSSRDMQLLSLFAGQAALAIQNSRVFSRLGRTLLEAVASATETDGDITSALERIARETHGPDAELAELGALFSELGRIGAEERRVVARMVGEFLAYLRGRQRWS